MRFKKATGMLLLPYQPRQEWLCAVGSYWPHSQFHQYIDAGVHSPNLEEKVVLVRR